MTEKKCPGKKVNFLELKQKYCLPGINNFYYSTSVVKPFQIPFIYKDL